MTRIVVIGDSMLDRRWHGRAERLCPDTAAPVVDLTAEITQPGGAALAATAAARLGAEVLLITALGTDQAGRHVARALSGIGIEVLDVGLAGATPEKIRLFAGDGTVARIDRGGVDSAPVGACPPAWADLVRRSDGVLVSDYGRGMAEDPDLARAIARRRPGSVVWDPHPRGKAPRSGTALATPNRAEARAALGGRVLDDHRAAEHLARRWRCAVALTCGADGVVVQSVGSPHHHTTQPANGDPCGAGDWFAAAATVALAEGSTIDDAVSDGMRHARTWIEGSHRTPSARETADREHPARSSTLVATSGCFDVLHVGHLAMLRHARGLGDRLVVLLNSDQSVRRLKGPGRPVNTQAERAELLEALEFVDEVVVFDEPTPCAALRRLRPDVYVKGADYAGLDIPERATLREWDGRIEFAALVADRSTSRIIDIAGRLAG